MTAHCENADCQDEDKFGYCCCKCEACMKRKDWEEGWAENQVKARQEEAIE